MENELNFTRNMINIEGGKQNLDKSRNRISCKYYDIVGTNV